MAPTLRPHAVRASAPSLLTRPEVTTDGGAAFTISVQNRGPRLHRPSDDGHCMVRPVGRQNVDGGSVPRMSPRSGSGPADAAEYCRDQIEYCLLCRGEPVIRLSGQHEQDPSYDPSRQPPRHRRFPFRSRRPRSPRLRSRHPVWRVAFCAGPERATRPSGQLLTRRLRFHSHRDCAAPMKRATLSADGTAASHHAERARGGAGAVHQAALSRATIRL
jgi:hypothetical protein